MDLFGSPNVSRMAADNDYEGLYKCLEHRNKLVRLQAAQALAELNDGTGWRFLMDTVRQAKDTDMLITAAAMLGELGHPRAVPVLGEVLRRTRFEPASGEIMAAIREALEAIGGPEAENALRSAGYALEEASVRQDGEADTVQDFDAQFVRPIIPQTEQIHFLTAEEHLNNAVQLREAEIPERGLVENSLALWIDPDLAYAWYIRGVLFEDLDRNIEAMLAYQQAAALDPGLADAQEALADLENDGNVVDLHAAELLADLNSREWQNRRNAAAGLGALLSQGSINPETAASALMEHLEDEEREVRHAVIEALGQAGERQSVLPLLALEESSWLIRFSILRTLALLGSVDGLITVLRREMNHIQDRNPVFSSHKDPLLEVEYDLLMEIGVRALERTGDLKALLTLAEENVWEDVETDEEDSGTGRSFDMEEYDEEDQEEEADEDLASYVDEVAQMAVTALDRLATSRLSDQPVDILQRLSKVPDLTLMDLSGEENEPLTVVDLSNLRQSAKTELVRRGL